MEQVTLEELNKRNEQSQKKMEEARADSVQAIAHSEEWRKKTQSEINARENKIAELQNEIADLQKQATSKDEILMSIDELKKEIHGINIPISVTSGSPEIKKLEAENKKLKDNLKDKVELKRNYKDYYMIHYHRILAFLLTVVFFWNQQVLSDLKAIGVFLKDNYFEFIYSKVPDKIKVIVISQLIHYAIPVIITLVILVLLYKLSDDVKSNYRYMTEVERNLTKIDIYSFISITITLLLLIQRIVNKCNLVLILLILIILEVLYITYFKKSKEN